MITAKDKFIALLSILIERNYKPATIAQPLYSQFSKFAVDASRHKNPDIDYQLDQIGEIEGVIDQVFTFVQCASEEEFSDCLVRLKSLIRELTGNPNARSHNRAIYSISLHRPKRIPKHEEDIYPKKMFALSIETGRIETLELSFRIKENQDRQAKYYKFTLVDFKPICYKK